MKILDSYVRVQRRVARLPAPYGSCQDPNTLDSTKNAYADFYPVNYSSTVAGIFTAHRTTPITKLNLTLRKGIRVIV